MTDYNKISKNQLKEWLISKTTKNEVIFDYVLDLYDDIMLEIENNELPLAIDEKTLLMKLSLFLYKNSYVNDDFNLS